MPWKHDLSLGCGGVLALIAAWVVYAFWEPPIARDLYGSVSEQSAQFDRALKERFPAGTPEAEVIRELRAQRFTSIASGRGMKRDATLPCGGELWVGWTAKDKTIAEIRGGMSVTCS